MAAAVAVSVAEVVIDAPRTRNALSTAVLLDLAEGIRRACVDPDVRIIVLSGAGDTFSSGADLKEAVAAERTAELVGQLYDAIATAPMPVIGRVKGHCLGLAVGLVAACDLAVAAHDATFVLPEPAFGQAPTLAALTVIPRLRRGDAGRLLLTGARIDGREAARIGLVDAAAAADTVDDVVAEWVDQVTRGAPGAVEVCKQLLRSAELRSDGGLAFATRLAVEREQSPEVAEAHAARAAGRRPAWASIHRADATAADGERSHDV